MKIIVDYNLEKDTWCLLNYGKNSTNSASQTKLYGELLNKYGEVPTDKETAAFIREYITANKIDISTYISDYQKDWDFISAEYQKRAENIFKIKLPENITSYITTNDRCPYNIKDNFFFVSLSKNSMRKVSMHELWHFYTWYKFGINWEKKIGKQKYNDIKESLTVLLNVECSDLFSEGSRDVGYPQHKELREKILSFWGKYKDLDKVWNEFV